MRDLRNAATTPFVPRDLRCRENVLTLRTRHASVPAARRSEPPWQTAEDSGRLPR